MKRILFVLIGVLVLSVAASGRNLAMVSGRVTAADGQKIEYATVMLKQNGAHVLTNAEGLYHLKTAQGKFTLAVSVIGYKDYSCEVELKSGQRVVKDIVLEVEAQQIDGVKVSAKSVSKRISQSAYNVVAIDTKSLHNSTSDLASALTKVSGIKLRETGGVGSSMQLSLDGFSGKHIKIFIDGVPQEGVGGSFLLNNIPVNFAERIEVYKGVVPVGFGADAIGGVVNIVTNKKRSLFVDASYSYGSFNTHRGYVNVGQNFKNGLTYEINAFANYSDNSYFVDTPVKDLQNGQIDRNKIEHVRRFHDNFHNEAIVGKFGVTGKSFADRLLFGVIYSQSDQDIQTGVRQEIVFGQKHRKNSSLMPSFEYAKRDLFTKGLDIGLTVNYNANQTHNIDTSTYSYNWRGQSKYNNGKIGEQSYQDDKFLNDNWNTTFNASYRIADRHSVIFNHVFSSYTRHTLYSVNAADNAAVASSFDKQSIKNISGLSYRFDLDGRFNISAFAKYYNQYSAGPRNSSTTGGFTYEMFNEQIGALGYGAAATYFIVDGLQAKLSYEKAYRMPTTEELFGDEDMELGAIGLRPENSNNANFSISYDLNQDRHSFFIETGVIYRDTRDYIKRTINSYSGGLYYGLYENHGRVQTKGVNVELQYVYNSWLNFSANVSWLDIRDKEKFIGGNTEQHSTTYNVQVPNTPYLFASGNLTFIIANCFAKRNNLSIGFDANYVHQFPLYWENHGDKKSKQIVPTQLSFDASLLYSIQNGRYNISLECRNLTNAELYDNFSLQKAGMAFYGKFRFFFNKI